MFELKRPEAEKRPSTLKHPAHEISINFNKGMKKQVSTPTSLEISDKFTMFMSGVRKPSRQFSSKMTSKRSASQISNREEKEKLFNKILNFKSEISSEDSDKSKKSVDESSRSVSSTENKSSKSVGNKRDKNFFHKIVVSKTFNFTIMIAIVINTVLLCMERYPMSKEEQVVQEYFNLVFTIVFF